MLHLFLACAMLVSPLPSALPGGGAQAEGGGVTPGSGEAGGTVRIVGRYVGPGVVCPQFRLEDGGETISLSGLPRDALTEGVRVTLTGRWEFVSTCMQGRGFAVEDILPG